MLTPLILINENFVLGWLNKTDQVGVNELHKSNRSIILALKRHLQYWARLFESRLPLPQG